MTALASYSLIEPESINASRAHVYARFMSRAVHPEDAHLLSCMIASWRAGDGVLPACLGLPRADFGSMLAFHFRGMRISEDPQTRGEMHDDRLPERADLVRLLLSERAGRGPTEEWMAQIVATACMGSDHLWQDVGLWSRRDLTVLMQRYFPALAALNIRDMKWKKFLYKQLCEREGWYVCRAPSCDVCVDYAKCFGPEE